MKASLVALALLALAPASHVSTCAACDSDVAIDSFHCSAPARIAPRHADRDARVAVNTRGGSATVLVTDEVVAIQLSDRIMNKVRRELRDEEDADDNALGTAIKAVVFSTVRTMLDHSAECRIRDLRDVRYRDGRLEIVTNDGDRLFQDLEVDREPVVESLSEHDALAVVREFHRVKDRER